jgi:hypothetical protein
VLYDVETRSFLARERNEVLHAAAIANSHRDHPARRWLAARLIAAGRRVEPECAPRPVARAS